MNQGRCTAEAYFAAMRARDIETLLSLFADDATLNLPDGRALVAIDAIRQWFATVFERAAPAPTPVHFVSDQRSIAAEIESTLSDGSTRRTANFFQFNDVGRIQRLTTYARS